MGSPLPFKPPTVADLEELASRMFEKEAALYVPSGTMGNLAAGRFPPGSSTD